MNSAPTSGVWICSDSLITLYIEHFFSTMQFSCFIKVPRIHVSLNIDIFWWLDRFP